MKTSFLILIAHDDLRESNPSLEAVRAVMRSRYGIEASAAEVSDALLERRELEASNPEGINQYTNGLNFTQTRLATGRHDEVVMADVDKVERSWAKDNAMHIDRGGAGGIGKRYQNAKDFISKADSIHMPEAAATRDGEVVFIDGRHRFAALRDAGHKTIPISVPKETAETFRSHFQSK